MRLYHKLAKWPLAGTVRASLYFVGFALVLILIVTYLAAHPVEIAHHFLTSP